MGCPEHLVHSSHGGTHPQTNGSTQTPLDPQTTLNLLERRGQVRLQGDMGQVAELTKTIRKAAKSDKRNWLDEQLNTGDWRPITQLKKLFPLKALTLTDPTCSNDTKSNANIFAIHLATEQWQEAGLPQGLATTPLYPNIPTISETTISTAEVQAAIRQTKAAKRAGKDNVPNDFWKHLEGRGLSALVSLFQLCWDSQNKSPTMETCRSGRYF